MKLLGQKENKETAFIIVQGSIIMSITFTIALLLCLLINIYIGRFIVGTIIY